MVPLLASLTVMSMTTCGGSTGANPGSSGPCCKRRSCGCKFCVWSRGVVCAVGGPVVVACREVVEVWVPRPHLAVLVGVGQGLGLHVVVGFVVVAALA